MVENYDPDNDSSAADAGITVTHNIVDELQAHRGSQKLPTMEEAVEEVLPTNSNSRDRESNFFKQQVRTVLTTLRSPATEDDYIVTNCDIFWTVFAIFCRVISIFINFNVAYDYHKNSKFNYFYWTLSCILIPMVVTICLQIAIFIQDYNASRNSKRPSVTDVVCFVIFLPFFFRYCQSLSYAIASKKAERRNDKAEQKRYYELLMHEDSDVALMRIFECFLEAAPQKILQISIILSGEDRISIPQLLAITSSLLSMAWCIASYHRCIRFSQVDKLNISWWGTIMQWLWHFLVTVSRVLSIAIVASIFPKWTLISFSVHAFVMGLWIFLFDKSPFCSTTLLHTFAFSLILGFVFIFNYILPKVRQTRYRYAVFYTICFSENIACVVIYICYSNQETIDSYYFIPLCILSVFPFLLGIFFMIIYYSRFHPNLVLMKRRLNQLEDNKQNTQTNGTNDFVHT